AREGNTAPYLQYAHARIRSIFRRADEDAVTPDGSELGGRVVLEAPEERALALNLVSFDSAPSASASNLQPHRLCTYLFEVATSLTAFYEACPGRRAEPELRTSRLARCDLSGKVLARGLNLLGIEAPERM